MIRYWLSRIAMKFMDAGWLHERRRQEVLARRHTQHIQRQDRHGHLYEEELLKRLERKEGQDA